MHMQERERERERELDRGCKVGHVIIQDSKHH